MSMGVWVREEFKVVLELSSNRKVKKSIHSLFDEIKIRQSKRQIDKCYNISWTFSSCIEIILELH